MKSSNGASSRLFNSGRVVVFSDSSSYSSFNSNTNGNYRSLARFEFDLFELPYGSTIGDVKKLIYRKYNIPIDQQLLGSDLWSYEDSQKLEFDYSNWYDLFVVGLFFAVKQLFRDNIIAHRHNLQVKTTLPVYPVGGVKAILQYYM